MINELVFKPEFTKLTYTIDSNTKQYTLTDISTHNNENDCWTAIDGNVYNVTDFINSHPGGREILKACGKDGTSLFHSESEHADPSATAVLKSHYIGILKAN